MQQFKIILNNDRIKFYDRFALFLLLLNASGIILFFFSNQLLIPEKVIGCIALLLIITAFAIYFLASYARKKKYYFLFAAMGMVAFWGVIAIWIIALLMLALAILYALSKEDLAVFISSENIIYPSFPKRKFNWQELNNVILKDDLFTIDLASNRIIQQKIDSSRTFVNEEKFNEFCRQQLVIHST